VMLSVLVAKGYASGAAETAALIAFIASVAIGLVIHGVIEKPLTRFLHELSRRKKPVQNTA
jgi:peptidoglycan/LPS O-acetylase OafA/YrhL